MTVVEPILERTTSAGWLSNSYLVADAPQGKAVVIDTGGPAAPILEKVKALGVTLTHVLCTHHHTDHILHNADYRAAADCRLGAHPLESRWIERVDLPLADGAELVTGGLHIRCLHVPGHTVGHLAFVVNEAWVFTGDTLFRGSAGGTCAPGHASLAELRRSILEVLLPLPGRTRVFPGHGADTRIAREWEENPFVRAWRGLEPQGSEPILALGRPATLLLRARDYDGGTKCWVRFDEDGREELVGGSAVSPRR
jgi:glyoxylase-like metal-dependent hydrolase (beta-lactamase superfamily II)